ncbi:cupin domain-containing protein [Serratia sp. T13T92]|uniref:cupin domain-containing protein n=1 Tax=Serratia sp. T13T92 TaxID=3397496 RepID=UPI0039DFCCDF
MKKTQVASATGLCIFKLASSQSFYSFGSQMLQGEKEIMHSHSEGEKWYIILSGDGQVFIVDEDKDNMSNQSTYYVSTGDIFYIPAHTTHHLLAHTKLEFIFLLPRSKT